MANIRRCRVGFSVVGTGKPEFGFSCGIGQYVDLDTIPEAARAHIPEGAFEDPAPAAVEPEAPTPRRRRDVKED